MNALEEPNINFVVLCIKPTFQLKRMIMMIRHTKV